MELDYRDDELIKQLFDLVDDDKDGNISKGEFKSLFLVKTSREIDLKLALRERFKTNKDAFNKLGGANDGKIDRGEFFSWLSEHLHFLDEDQNEELFKSIDDDNNGYITIGE